MPEDKIWYLTFDFGSFESEYDKYSGNYRPVSIIFGTKKILSNENFFKTKRIVGILKKKGKINYDRFEVGKWEVESFQG